MAESATDVWDCTIFVSNDWSSTIDVAFTDGGATWDNNGGNDWHADIIVPEPAAVSSVLLALFIMRKSSHAISSC